MAFKEPRGLLRSSQEAPPRPPLNPDGDQCSDVILTSCNIQCETQKLQV
jgi:hypothetical protein